MKKKRGYKEPSYEKEKVFERMAQVCHKDNAACKNQTEPSVCSSSQHHNS